MTSDEIVARQEQLAKQIKGAKNTEIANLFANAGKTFALFEIATQLADLNETLKSFDYNTGTRIFDVRPRES